MEKRETQLIQRITHFTFQLCRKTQTLYPYNTKINATLVTFENQLNDLLFSLKGYLFISEYQEERNKYLDLLSFLFKLIAYTRDIYNGKGERDLTYSMIMVWYKHFPKLAMYIFEKLCSSVEEDKTRTVFGSWKDAKYLCHYIKTNTNILSEEKKEKCIENIIQIMNTQLHIDVIQHNHHERERATPRGSLIAKWIPREKSKFGWLYESLVKHWNENFEKTTQIQTPYQNYKKYRKLVSSLNQKINTTQIKQCERKSNEIDYYQVSLITKHKNADYFLQNPTKSNTNIKTNTKPPILHYDIGELCREHYLEKNPNPLLWEKIRENILSTKSNSKREKYLLPILDMTSNNIEDGIAISILLSEISEIPNRIMTYDQTKTIWISLEPPLSLHDKKKTIKNHNILSDFFPKNNIHSYNSKNQDKKQNNASNTSILHIIKSILETKLPLEKIEDMYLVFISDFQRLDKDTKCSDYDHYSLIQYMFRENGILKIPNIIYWNISTEIVCNHPCLPTTPNVLFLAGTASSNFQYLFEFENYNSDIDIDSTAINPFSFYKRILSQEKYQAFERYLKNHLYV